MLATRCWSDFPWFQPERGSQAVSESLPAAQFFRPASVPVSGAVGHGPCLCYGARMSTGLGDPPNSTAVVARVGGVRADFVANLGRRLTEMRQHWALLEQEPGSPRCRDEVRRRLHALGTRARLLEFFGMADRLDEGERRLERAAAVGGHDADDLAWFHQMFAMLPTLAWNDIAPAQDQPIAMPTYAEPLPPAPQPVAVPAASSPELPSKTHTCEPPGPIAVLVVGPQHLSLHSTPTSTAVTSNVSG